MCDGMVVHVPIGLALQLLLVLNTLPVCHASGCPRPSAVPGGGPNLTESGHAFFPAGTLLQYSCDPGYTLSGESVLTCTPPGHWSPGPPQCVRNKVCSPPSQPENAGYLCHPSPCPPKLTEGTVIEFFCDEGYTLKGYRYRTCQNGDWDSAAPIVCHLGQGKEERSPLAMPALSIVGTTASSVVLILLLVVLFVLLQPKLKSFHHSRREQAVCGQASSLVVEGVQVPLPSYEEAVYGSGGAVAPPPESRVSIVLSEGPPAEAPPTELRAPRPDVPSSSACRHSETVLVHQGPNSSSSSLSSPSWAAEQRGAAAVSPRRQSEASSDQHSLLSLASAEEYGDDIPLLKEA